MQVYCGLVTVVILTQKIRHASRVTQCFYPNRGLLQPSFSHQPMTPWLPGFQLKTHLLSKPRQSGTHIYLLLTKPNCGSLSCSHQGPTIVHSPAVYKTSHPSNMNATSALELWAFNLFEPFFQIQESPEYYTITEEILGLAKANITEHVTTLLSTQNNESIAESINFLSEVLIEYSRK